MKFYLIATTSLSSADIGSRKLVPCLVISSLIYPNNESNVDELILK